VGVAWGLQHTGGVFGGRQLLVGVSVRVGEWRVSVCVTVGVTLGRVAVPRPG